MKLYHATTKQIYNEHIIKEGLKPIEDIEKKSYPSEDDLRLYFFENIDDAIEFKSPEDGIVIEVDVRDILRQCHIIHEEPSAVFPNEYDVIAEPYAARMPEHIYKYPYGYKDCVIPPDKIRVVE
jgi:hypothetical protein